MSQCRACKKQVHSKTVSWNASLNFVGETVMRTSTSFFDGAGLSDLVSMVFDALSWSCCSSPAQMKHKTFLRCGRMNKHDGRQRPQSRRKSCGNGLLVPA